MLSRVVSAARGEMKRPDVLHISTADKPFTNTPSLTSVPQAFGRKPCPPCAPAETEQALDRDECFLPPCGPGGHSGNSSSKTGGKLKVLVVEDEPADIELVLHALRQAGFEVVADIAQGIL